MNLLQVTKLAPIEILCITNSWVQVQSTIDGLKSLLESLSPSPTRARKSSTSFNYYTM